MREQLKLLEELQAVDLRLKQTEDELGTIPARLQSMRDDVAAVEALLEGERGQLSEVQGYRAELQQLVQSQQTQLDKAKAKLTQVKTSKEYMAVQREFESNRRIVGEREQEIGKLSQAIDETTQSIEKHEGELEALREHVVEEERESQSQVAELERKVQDQLGGRNETAAGLKKHLLRKYDQIRKMRDGLAVVPAVDGVCTGCRMQLAPQLYNILQRFESIEQCPNCQRIVFFRREDPAPEAQPAVASDPEAGREAVASPPAE